MRFEKEKEGKRRKRSLRKEGKETAFSNISLQVP